MMRQAPVVLALLAAVAWSEESFAEAPSGKLVMLDVDKLANVTSKHEPDNYHLSWRELVNTGINGVHFRHWTGSGDSDAYTQAEWTQEAHEYGLWVAGGGGADHPVATVVTEAADLAAMGVDFIQLDEPMGFGLTEAGYNSIRDAVRAVDPTIPVIITDVFYNDTVGSWAAVDGLAQEVYIDDWYANIDKAVAYKNSHPGQEVMMWVWLPERLVYPEEPCTTLPDSKFDLWFGDSFDKVGQVLMFIFQSRDTLGDACAWGTDWTARAATIAAKTAGYRVALPEWQSFAATGTSDGSPDCSVVVSSAGAGLDPASVEAYYSVDGGVSWSQWEQVDCTGSYGSTGWETITATNVPFNQESSSLNKLKFKITDTYTGDYYRSARTDKMVYDVTIEQISASDAGAGAGDAQIGSDDGGSGADDGGVGVDDPTTMTGGCGCQLSAARSSGWPGTPPIGLALLVMLAHGLRRAGRRAGRGHR